MFDALKEKLSNVQLDLKSGFRSRKSPSLTKLPSSQSLILNNLDHNAGAELLNHYQEQFHVIHAINEHSAHRAGAISTEVAVLKTVTEQGSSQLSELSRELATLPHMRSNIEALASQVADVKLLCEEVQKSLAYFEVINATKLFQARRLELKFQLALYREKRMEELGNYKAKLTEDYMKKVEGAARRRQVDSRVKQKVLQEAYDADVDYYKKTGKMPEKIPVSQKDSVDSLSDVEVEPDESCELETFLNEEIGGSSPSGARSLILEDTDFNSDSVLDEIQIIDQKPI